MSESTQLVNILIVVLIVLIFIVFVLGFIYIFIKLKNNNSNNKTKKENKKTFEKEETGSNLNVNKTSIFKFMEFDKIEDHMIIQKNGERYIMVVECQGINYDLMSSAEKNAVEEGFIQFLNTLRHPIQIYIQTKTVNLEDSLQRYNNTLKQIEDEFLKRQRNYEEMQNSGRYTKEQLDREFYEVTKKKNLYEYGKDVIQNTESMSLNKNVLKKQYYIIIPFYAAELGNDNFDKEEIKNMAFSELYTKSQSIIRTLMACNVNGKILDSYGLAELLYTAYNRDGAETFGINKALKAGYDELYSTAPDVIEKKMLGLDQKIKEEAMLRATQEVEKVKFAKQTEYENIQKNSDTLIEEMAELILKQNSNYIGKDIAKKAIENIKNPEDNSKEKGGNIDVEQKTVKKRGRKPKTA